MEKGKLLNGKQVGIWKTKWKDGSVEEVIFNEQGFIEDKVKIINNQGEFILTNKGKDGFLKRKTKHGVIIEGNLLNGMKTGIWKQSKNGTTLKVNYKYGCQYGDFTVKNEHGKYVLKDVGREGFIKWTTKDGIIEEGEIKDGIKAGIW